MLDIAIESAYIRLASRRAQMKWRAFAWLYRICTGCTHPNSWITYDSANEWKNEKMREWSISLSSPCANSIHFLPAAGEHRRDRTKRWAIGWNSETSISWAFVPVRAKGGCVKGMKELRFWKLKESIFLIKQLLFQFRGTICYIKNADANIEVFLGTIWWCFVLNSTGVRSTNESRTQCRLHFGDFCAMKCLVVRFACKIAQQPVSGVSVWFNGRQWLLFVVTLFIVLQWTMLMK